MPLTDYETERKKHLEYFDKVCDPNDWRAPIDSIVTVPTDTVGEELERYIDAIVFFTGIDPNDITLNCVKHGTGNIDFRFRCVGYRNGPCGP